MVMITRQAIARRGVKLAVTLSSPGSSSEGRFPNPAIRMVEAVGIEPTSESLRQQNLHAYQVSLLLPAGNWDLQTNPPKPLH